MHIFTRIVTFLSATIAIPASLSAAGSEGVSPKAYELTNLFGLPITNAMVTTWVISLLIILVVKILVGKPQLVPTRGQGVIESVISGTKSMMEPIVGKKMVGPVFPLIFCLFLYILMHNWSGLLPTVGAFGLEDEEGHLKYWFRPAHSDLNSTAALALIAMVSWLFFIMKYAGPKVVFIDIFGNKADKNSTPSAIYYPLFLLFAAVGVIEIVSIMIRPVSLSLRLFGNVYGGESLLDKMLNILPNFPVVAFPFYLFETMVGFVQALVFCLLVCVYIGLICNHDDGEHGEHH
ncbi:MAG: F0F1 ATP synthase subunit A [Verrucomicrobiota bacterium]